MPLGHHRSLLDVSSHWQPPSLHEVPGADGSDSFLSKARSLFPPLPRFSSKEGWMEMGAFVTYSTNFLNMN